MRVSKKQFEKELDGLRAIFQGVAIIKYEMKRASRPSTGGKEVYLITMAPKDNAVIKPIEFEGSLREVVIWMRGMRGAYRFTKLHFKARVGGCLGTMAGMFGMKVEDK